MRRFCNLPMKKIILNEISKKNITEIPFSIKTPATRPTDKIYEYENTTKNLILERSDSSTAVEGGTARERDDPLSPSNHGLLGSAMAGKWKVTAQQWKHFDLQQP